MSISIIIPYQTDHGPREKTFNWLIQYYKNTLSSAEICIGTSGKVFNKSKAVNEAASSASGDIFVIIDADTICSPEVIKQSIQLLRKYPWIIPYKKVLDLTKDSSMKVLQSPPAWPFSVTIDASIRNTGRALPVGGINIMKRECFEAVGGFDERFRGWGGEDDAFAASVNTLCGRSVRLNNAIYHLWHPTSLSKDNEHYNDNVQLALRYCRAHGNKRKMKQIISERP